MKLTKLSLTSLLLLCCVFSSAQENEDPPAFIAGETLAYYDFEVDGIYYSFLSGDSVEISYGSSYGNSYSGDLVIPESVVYNNNTYKVVAIGKYTFTFCTDLNSITIPTSIYSVSYSILYECSSLKSITFPSSVVYIANHCFFNAIGLESINIAASQLDSIGKHTFSYCTSLRNLYLNQTTPNSNITSSNFTGVTLSSISLFVPIGSASIYSATGAPWSSFNSINQYYNLEVNGLATNGTGNYYATLYADAALAVPSGVQTAYVSTAENGLLTYTQISDVVPANTAILATTSSAGDYIFTESSSTPAAPSGNLLQGVATETILSNSNTYYYCLSRAEDSNDNPVTGSIGFYWFADDGHSLTCPSNRCYLALPASPSSARGFLLDDIWETTAIEKRATINAATGKTIFYDMNGHRMYNSIDKSGVYIANGKKIFIKK